MQNLKISRAEIRSAKVKVLQKSLRSLRKCLKERMLARSTIILSSIAKTSLR